MRTLKFITLEQRIVLDATLTGGLFLEMNATRDDIAWKENRANFEKILNQNKDDKLECINGEIDFLPFPGF